MILIAPDKFKGTFTAAQICASVESRLRRYGYHGEIISRPLSDGGEGTAAVLMPNGLPLARGVYESPDHRRRLIVSSEIVGPDNFGDLPVSLWDRSSFALGEAVVPDLPTEIAVGGTFISDGGAGFLQALGVKFYDHSQHLIERPLTPRMLVSIASADTSSLNRFQLSGVIDVRAQLCMDNGGLSAVDFAIQKGLNPSDKERLNRALQHFSSVLGGHSEYDGAGGGLGYALASVVKAPCRPGAEAAVASADIPWENISLVITGEGSVDRQTTEGNKLVHEIWLQASRRGIPVVVAFGKRDDSPLPYEKMIQIDDLDAWQRLARELS